MFKDLCSRHVIRRSTHCEVCNNRFLATADSFVNSSGSENKLHVKNRSRSCHDMCQPLEWFYNRVWVDCSQGGGTTGILQRSFHPDKGLDRGLQIA